MKHSVFTVLLPDKKLEETFQLLSELNYDGVELRIKDDYHVPPGEIENNYHKIRELMNKYNLEIPVLATYLSIMDRDLLAPIFKTADQLGTKGVRVSLGTLGNKQTYWATRDQLLFKLENFLQLIQPFQVKALFEIHFKTLISSPSLAYLLFGQFDPARIGVIIDPGNMIVEGNEDLRLGMELLGQYLSHVHVKNTAWLKENKWIYEWDDLEDGIADWKDIMKILSDLNYQGYLSNENLKDVNLMGATGLINEKLPEKKLDKSKQSIKEKLQHDLKYLKFLESEVKMNK